MDLGRLSNGEKIAGVSAILLFAFMFFDWFGVKFTEHSNLLSSLNRFPVPGKSAWEALDYIPIVLLIAVTAALGVVLLRLTETPYEPPIRANAVVAVLGIASVLLILFRIVDPPNFGSIGGATEEGTVQFPIFLALAAAAGIAFGGCMAMWGEGIREPSTA